MLLPCRHIMAVLSNIQHNLMDFIPSMYKVKILTFSIPNTDQYLPLLPPIKPPPRYNGYGQEDSESLPKIGRPQRRRIESTGEFKLGGKGTRFPKSKQPVLMGQVTETVVSNLTTNVNAYNSDIDFSSNVLLIT
jgi:hypothetical protein